MDGEAFTAVHVLGGPKLSYTLPSMDGPTSQVTPWVFSGPKNGVSGVFLSRYIGTSGPFMASEL